MNRIEKEKRDGAFWPWLVLWIITPDIALLQLLLPKDLGICGRSAAALVLLVTRGIQLFLWFKIFFHWARAKGQSGWFCLYACLGPLGLICMPFLRDEGVTTDQPTDPMRQCPHCAAEYRLGEYNQDAEHIYCSKCKAELPRT